MATTIYTINTVSIAYDIIIEPFGRRFLDKHPSAEVRNITDDGLLAETREHGGITEQVQDRMLLYARAAELSGASGILVTCPSVVDGSEYIKRHVRIPVINIAEPAVQMAVERGERIGIIGTIPTSPGAIIKLIDIFCGKSGKRVEVVSAVAEGAFDALCDGSRDKHDELVCSALYRLAAEVDAVVFAQTSMSLLKHEPLDIPLYKLGDSGYEKLWEIVTGI